MLLLISSESLVWQFVVLAPYLSSLFCAENAETEPVLLLFLHPVSTPSAYVCLCVCLMDPKTLRVMSANVRGLNGSG